MDSFRTQGHLKAARVCEAAEQRQEIKPENHFQMQLRSVLRTQQGENGFLQKNMSTSSWNL